MNENDIYVGNGKTITVTPGAQTKVFDIPKALSIFEENKTVEICMGMREDWFFTGQRVGTEEEIKNFPLMASKWATPVIEVDGKIQECYFSIDKEKFLCIFDDGFKRGVAKADFWLPDFHKRWAMFEYEQLKKFWNEVDLVLTRYER